MKLLIVTQAVDADDPVLGFFHRWVEEFSKHCESIQVICLKEGRHALPTNVKIHSLGKEVYKGPASARKGPAFVNRVCYVVRFYRYTWKLRREYDAVFVHMNQEYVLLGGFWWRLQGKRVILWRNHKVGSFLTNFACMLVKTVCYTSPAAYVAPFKNAQQMPVGIDTNFFTPSAPRAHPESILFLGRLDPVKRVEVFVQALEHLHESGLSFKADIVGDPTDPKSTYAHDVRNKAAHLALDGILEMRPGVSNDSARGLFTSHGVYCNLTPSGSFDKTIGEAMASGCIVVTCNDAVRGVVPPQLFVGDQLVESLARALSSALALSGEERSAIAARQRSYIEHEHSLTVLAKKLFQMFS